ncbi:hypothetical protein AeRB84_005499 [Aphanomyces euteiches]|nr:hypothetical protein AeRB84_005499 [Aphanomyces euteiches]
MTSVIVSSSTPGGIARRPRPTIATKLWAVSVNESMPLRQAVVETGFSKTSLTKWLQEKPRLLAFSGSKTRRKNVGKTGKEPILPDGHDLAVYMRDRRRLELALTAAHMIRFIRVHRFEWLCEYMTTRKSPYKSLLQLLQRFSDRNGFSRQRICRQKRSQEKLEATRLAFAQEFHEKYGDVPAECIYNADETGIYYDMCPSTIWAERGKGSYVSNAEKHSFRMTAVLTVRADGEKLPIVFVIRGVTGGTIECNEFDDYPEGHTYLMQERAWVNGTLWAKYLRDVLGPNIEEPSLLLVDNFECHVSEESERIVGEELGRQVVRLPPNSPFKQHLLDLWVIAEDHAITAKEKRIAMIKRAIEAWGKISRDEVIASFHKALPKS